ncbi:hypothetical protein OAT67_05125, partial [Bacteriovoracaceae bacterium]|nr:hypothetical protein [Bacteriovoracaceae bacterium]
NMKDKETREKSVDSISEEASEIREEYEKGEITKEEFDHRMVNEILGSMDKGISSILISTIRTKQTQIEKIDSKMEVLENRKKRQKFKALRESIIYEIVTTVEEFELMTTEEETVNFLREIKEQYQSLLE